MKSFLLAALLSVLLLSISLKEVSADEELTCNYRGMGQKEDTKKTCTGTDLACRTAVDKETGEAKLKDCGTKQQLDSLCGLATYVKAKCKDSCTTELCNDEK